MLYTVRKALSRPNLANFLGYDIDGEIISKGDKVLVVEEQDERKNNPDYNFCNVGSVGQAIKNLYDDFDHISWIIIVDFENDGEKKTVGCGESKLRRVS